MSPVMPRGYHSAIEYQYSEEQGDAIVRIASYHRKEFCTAVISFPPGEHDSIRSSIATPFRQAPDTGLGSLQRLPLELLDNVVLSLDMNSLFIFRQVNLRCRELVDSLPQYQRVVAHGLDLFCALLRTELAIHIPLFNFDWALCAKNCAFCGEFAGFVALLLWERCCFKCLRIARETQVQTLTATKRQFHFTKADINQLRSLKTLPGTYTMLGNVYKSRITVVSAHQAVKISGQPPPPRPGNSEQNQRFNFMAACALPYYDRRTGKVEHGMSCAGCQLALERHIIGYRGESRDFAARDKVYSKDGFLKHFRWCEQAQLLWNSSEEGKIMPPELPEAARQRGYFSNRE
ncbi:hypothetical protein F5Y12DRAFT_785827 [Xylaria sp. FL1777]|nr:hypothetical protein F5Y12DRAFT_785827 [Xylaria sp. FL1777]